MAPSRRSKKSTAAPPSSTAVTAANKSDLVDLSKDQTTDIPVFSASNSQETTLKVPESTDTNFEMNKKRKKIPVMFGNTIARRAPVSFLYFPFLE